MANPAFVDGGSSPPHVPNRSCLKQTPTPESSLGARRRLDDLQAECDGDAIDRLAIPS